MHLRLPMESLRIRLRHKAGEFQLKRLQYKLGVGILSPPFLPTTGFGLCFIFIIVLGINISS